MSQGGLLLRGFNDEITRLASANLRVLEVIDAMNSMIPPIEVSKIHEATGIPRTSVSRTVQALKRAGVRLRADYSLKRLAFYLVSVLYEGLQGRIPAPEDTIKVEVTTPLGVLGVHFAPSTAIEDAIDYLLYARRSARRLKVVIASDALLPKPSLSEIIWEAKMRVDPTTAWKAAERIAAREDYRKRTPIIAAVQSLGEEMRLKPVLRDSLDMSILSGLEIDTFKALDFFASHAKVRKVKRKFNNHLKKHVTTVLRGSFTYYFDKGNAMILVFTRGVDCLRHNLLTLLAYPYTSGILVGSPAPSITGEIEVYDALITLSVPPEHVTDTVNLLSESCRWDDVSYEVVTRVELRYSRKFAMPAGLFDKRNLNWKNPFREPSFL